MNYYFISLKIVFYQNIAVITKVEEISPEKAMPYYKIISTHCRTANKNVTLIALISTGKSLSEALIFASTNHNMTTNCSLFMKIVS